MHSNIVNKVNTLEEAVSEDLQPRVVHIDVGKEYTNIHEFTYVNIYLNGSI